jgi:hypothetical protein
LVTDDVYADAVCRGNYVDVVLDALVRHKKKLLLVVDGLEKLYSLDLHKDRLRAVAGVDTLWSLGGLSCVAGDCTAVLMCGSSCFLPLLIRREVDRAVSKEFPNVMNAPHLNGTKFFTYRVHWDPPPTISHVPGWCVGVLQTRLRVWLCFRPATVSTCLRRALGMGSGRPRPRPHPRPHPPSRLFMMPSYPTSAMLM